MKQLAREPLYVCAALAAMLHCAVWAGGIHHFQRVSHDALEQRQGVIEKITFSQTGVGGQHTRARTLVLTVRPIGDPAAVPQELSSGAQRDVAARYFEQHRTGEVVPIWVRRQSGRIDDVLPPAQPDFLRLFLQLLLPLGGVTGFAVLLAFHRK